MWESLLPLEAPTDLRLIYRTSDGCSGNMSGGPVAVLHTSCCMRAIADDPHNGAQAITLSRWISTARQRNCYSSTAAELAQALPPYKDAAACEHMESNVPECAGVSSSVDFYSADITNGLQMQLGTKPRLIKSTDSKFGPARLLPCRVYPATHVAHTDT